MAEIQRNYTETTADLDTLFREINGNLDNANIKPAAGIVQSKLSLNDATDTVKGIATFDEDSFVVTSGDVKPEFIGARAYISAPQNGIATGWVKVNLDVESYDVGANFASNKFTAPVSGYYEVKGQVRAGASVDAKFLAVGIYVGGVEKAQCIAHMSSTDSVGAHVSDIIHLDATDYVELYIYNGTGAALLNIGTGTNITYLAVRLIAKD